MLVYLLETLTPFIEINSSILTISVLRSFPFSLTKIISIRGRQSVDTTSR